MSTKRIAILATNGFEESELSEPKRHLESKGWTVEIVSPEPRSIKAWAKKDWGKEYPVDRDLDAASAKDFDALVIPGGVINPDKLRIDEQAIAFIKDFFDQDKPVAAICHGPQLLINAKVVNGRTMTSVENISQDLKNAGARWVDEEVVVDGKLVTSRTPKDLPTFNQKIAEVFERG